MKKINLHNYNNRMATDVFVHISDAPDKPILESQLPIRVRITEIGNDSSSAPQAFEADMIDFARCELHELSSIYTYLSHGISRDQFLSKNKTSQKMAIYIYKKV